VVPLDLLAQGANGEMQLGYWIFQILEVLAIAVVCDANFFGNRRRRAFVAAGFVAVIIGRT
jgi:hypothetical protein